MLTANQASQIAMGDINKASTLVSTQPRSLVIGYTANTEKSFSKPRAVVISDLVAEKIYSTHIKTLWNTMIASPEKGWAVFEAFCRNLMCSNYMVEFQCRRCSGKQDPSYNDFITKTLGHCTGIQLVPDIVKEAAENRKVVFHSTNRQNTLIDFIYRDSDEEGGRFHAFQVTLGQKHSAKVENIRALEQRVGLAPLSIYFLLPSDRFDTFVTNPVDPTHGCTTDIWHVCINDPSKEKVTLY